VCRVCTDQPASMERNGMDVVEGTAVELLNKFCFLVDVLSVGGDTDAAVEARVHKGWNKFR